jgi:hypothetical protein
MAKNIKITFIILFVLVFLSLALNLYLIYTFLNLRRQALQVAREVRPVVQESLALADAELEAFQQSTMDFNIKIDEELPVQVAIPISETLEIPLQMNFPISETIETTVMIDPFEAGLEIPVDIAVPVDLEIPINMVVPVPISRTIPLSTSVPVNLDLPITINVSETPLVEYIEDVRTALVAFNQWLDQTAAAFE